MNFRAINSTYNFEEQMALSKAILQHCEYLGDTAQNISYYRHDRGDGINDYYCRASTTQTQWIGTEPPTAQLYRSKFQWGWPVRSQGLRPAIAGTICDLSSDASKACVRTRDRKKIWVEEASLVLSE